jgi:hypothetical protein
MRATGKRNKQLKNLFASYNEDWCRVLRVLLSHVQDSSLADPTVQRLVVGAMPTQLREIVQVVLEEWHKEQADESRNE